MNSGRTGKQKPYKVKVAAMKATRLIISLLLLTCLPSLSLSSEYLPWSEKVFVHVEQEYGMDVGKRVRYLHKLMLDDQQLR